MTSELAARDEWRCGITWLDEPLQTSPAGPLAGRTVLVKDLIDTAGIRTTYGSRIYGDHVPERHAPAVQRLLDAGAALVGKASLPEFAWNVTGQSPWYGTVGNPAHPGRTTGGSSSGNAAALAAGLVELGLGSDTGCSIRLPSACCETVGLKSAWGRIPTDGVFPLVPAVDTVGPMARSVEDAALLWSVLTGEPVPEPRLHGLTVGILRDAPWVGGPRELPRSDAADAWTADLQRLGARVVEAEIPEPAADTWPFFFRSALASHAATFPARADEYGDNCRTKLERALTMSEDDAAEGRRAIEAWRRYRPPVDLYVAPCIAIDLPPEDVDELDVRIPFTAFLRWVNLIGWAGLAIGNLQLIAPRDETVLAAGLAWERG